MLRASTKRTYLRMTTNSNPTRKRPTQSITRNYNNNNHKRNSLNKRTQSMNNSLQNGQNGQNGQNVQSEAIKKISQIELSEEQQNLKSRILKFISKNLKENNSNLPSVFLINGDAGTGKSVILNSLFNEIQKKSKSIGSEIGNGNGNDDEFKGTQNYLIVNHPEMLKLYHQISNQYPYISKKNLERPIFINLKKNQITTTTTT